MTLTGNIRKYWTLRKTGKQEPSRSQSTQKRMSIISMEYPSSCQIFGNQYYEKTKQRKQPPKLQHHQTESRKVRNRVWFRTGPNSKSTNQERPQNISILCKHIIPDTHSHTHTLCLTTLSLGVKSKTSSNQRVSAIIRPCDSMQKPPRQTQIRRNSLPKASKDTSASRVTILIQNTSTRSISSSRIIMNIFILLKTPMITDRTWTMIMILWLTLTLILSLS